jgi:hypothetical protein
VLEEGEHDACGGPLKAGSHGTLTQVYVA